MSTKYNSVADKTAIQMVDEYVMHAYNTIKAVHPECGGFSLEVTEEGDKVRTRIDLLVPKEVSG